MPKSKKASESKRARMPRTVLGPMPLRLDRVALRRLEYTEVPREEAPTRANPAKGVPVSLRMQVAVAVNGEEVELSLDVLASPDASHLPYQVHAAISAYIVRPPDMPDQQIVDFAAGPGVRILFPYIREVISSVSARGVYGPLYIDPMSISALAPEGD